MWIYEEKKLTVISGSGQGWIGSEECWIWVRSGREPVLLMDDSSVGPPPGPPPLPTPPPPGPPPLPTPPTLGEIWLVEIGMFWQPLWWLYLELNQNKFYYLIILKL